MLLFLGSDSLGAGAEAAGGGRSLLSSIFLSSSTTACSAAEVVVYPGTPSSSLLSVAIAPSAATAETSFPFSCCTVKPVKPNRFGVGGGGDGNDPTKPSMSDSTSEKMADAGRDCSFPARTESREFGK